MATPNNENETTSHAVASTNLDKVTPRWQTEVGTWSDEYGIYRLRLNLELRVQHDGSCQTVDHNTLDRDAGYLELSITGETDCRPHAGRRWEEGSGGQNREDLLKVTDFAKGWDRTVAERVYAVWNRWHLNGMKAACAHQAIKYETDQYGRRVPSLKLTPACPETGYKYGHAWLVEQMDFPTVQFIRQLPGGPDHGELVK